MANRDIRWAVGADCCTVSPAGVQEGGVQGEHNATLVTFSFGEESPLADASLQLYIECVDATGGYDKTPPLPVSEGTVSTLVPLAWTQFGGVVTLRLVGEKEGQILYTLEGRLRFAGRQTATRQVDSLLRTHIQQAIEVATTAADRASEAASAAKIGAAQALESAAETAAHANNAQKQAATAQAAAVTAEHAALEAAELLDDTLARRDKTWSSYTLLTRLCPPFTNTGDLVPCSPVEGYPLEIKADMKNLLTIGRGQGDKFGVTFTDNGDGSYTLNGTATNSASWVLTLPDISGLEVGDVLRLTGCPAGGNTAYHLVVEGAPGEYFYDVGDGVEFPYTEGMQRYELLVLIFVAGNVECDNLTFWPRLVKVADAPTTVTQCGKNLWDFNAGVQKVTVTTNTNGDRAEYFGYAVHLPPGTYTLHADRVSGTTARYIYGDINGADGSHKADVNIVAGATATAKTFTITEGDVLYIYNGNVASTEAGSNNVFKEYNVQVEQGTVATPYEPFRGQSFPVDVSGTLFVPAIKGLNILYADKGPLTVSGRLDPVPLLDMLVQGGEGS